MILPHSLTYALISKAIADLSAGASLVPAGSVRYSYQSADMVRSGRRRLRGESTCMLPSELSVCWSEFQSRACRRYAKRD